MFSFTSAKSVEFLPDEEARAWVAEGIGELAIGLGEPAARPRLLTHTDVPKPQDLDELFDVICGVQAEVGQAQVEFSLVELDPGSASRQVPPGFEPLGNPEGQLLHTFARSGEFVIVAVPAVLRVPALVFASIARELGRIAVAQLPTSRGKSDDVEADAELAAVVLGMGVWVANGAYIYENACCGGGCGLDLKSLRAGLSLPEACFALAVDAARRGISPRVASKHLESTQKAAFKRSAGFVAKAPQLLQLAAPSTTALSSG